MKILVIGASGQVGGLLMERANAGGWICTGTSFKISAPGLVPLDIRDEAKVKSTVRTLRPDVVFLPGALTFVDYCESHPDECKSINVDGTKHVAEAVRNVGARLVFFSTEQIFGDSLHAHKEDDPPEPLCEYSKSKWLAEEQIRAILPEQHLILRTSWVYGPEVQRKNFVYRAARTLQAGEKLLVPLDQYGQPTFSPDLADAALALLTLRKNGTYHAVGPEHLTRLQFAQLIADCYRLDAGLIEGINTAQLKQPAKRSLNVKLCRDRLIETLGCRPIRRAVDALNAMRPFVIG